MVRTLALMTAGLVLCGAMARGDDATKPAKAKVSAASVQLYKEIKLNEKDSYPTQGGMTRLGVHVALPGKYILAVDSTSAVSKFTDDKDTSLASAFQKPAFGMFPMYGKERSGLIIDVTGYKGPATGASKILLKGNLVLLCGLDPKVTEEKELEVKEKTEHKVGDFTFKFGPSFGGTPGISIVSSKANLKSLSVTDADGKEIMVSSYGTYGPGPFTKEKVWTSSFGMFKKADKIKVKISYFTKDEKVEVPIDLSVGLGL